MPTLDLLTEALRANRSRLSPAYRRFSEAGFAHMRCSLLAGFSPVEGLERLAAVHSCEVRRQLLTVHIVIDAGLEPVKSVAFFDS